jgi:NADH-quinone oxidoreductase subunit H
MRASTILNRMTSTEMKRYLTLAPSVAGFLFLAPARDLSQLAESFNVAALFILAVLAPQLLAILLTDEPTPVTFRHALQKITFQLPLALALLTPLLALSSFNLLTISLQQSESFSHWQVFHDPFNAAAFLLAMIGVQGTLGQRPQGARIMNMPMVLLLSALVTSLFLGGWYDPFGIISHLESVSHEGQGISSWPLAVLANALGVICFVAKILVLTGIHQSLARNLPRYRLDEVLQLNLRLLLPAAAFNILSAAAYLWLTEPLRNLQLIIQIILTLIGTGFGLVLAVSILYARRSNKRSVNTP